MLFDIDLVNLFLSNCKFQFKCPLMLQLSLQLYCIRHYKTKQKPISKDLGIPTEA